MYVEALQILASNDVGVIAPSPDGKGLGADVGADAGAGAGAGKDDVARQMVLGEISLGRAALKDSTERRLAERDPDRCYVTPHDELMTAIKGSGEAPLNDATVRELRARDPDRWYITPHDELMTALQGGEIVSLKKVKSNDRSYPIIMGVDDRSMNDGDGGSGQSDHGGGGGGGGDSGGSSPAKEELKLPAELSDLLGGFDPLKQVEIGFKVKDDKSNGGNTDLGGLLADTSARLPPNSPLRNPMLSPGGLVLQLPPGASAAAIAASKRVFRQSMVRAAAAEAAENAGGDGRGECRPDDLLELPLPPGMMLDQGRSKSPLATDNLLENTDGHSDRGRGGGSEHPIIVLSGRPPATFYLC